MRVAFCDEFGFVPLAAVSAFLKCASLNLASYASARFCSAPLVFLKFMKFASVASSAFMPVAKKHATDNARVLNFKFHPLNLAKFYDFCKNLTPDGSKCKIAGASKFNVKFERQARQNRRKILPRARNLHRKN